MDFQEIRNELQTLLSDLSSVIAQGEWKWHQMASDYETKYGNTGDYDPSFKQDYSENAETCREIAQSLEELSVPAHLDEIGSFMSIVRKEAGYCPRHWELNGQVSGVLESMEQLMKELVRSQL